MKGIEMTEQQNPFNVAGKVALVTGGGQGIGREVVRTLAGAGADIAIADLNMVTASEAAAEVKGMGRRAMAVKVNVADPADVEAMTAAVIAELGRVDILVNNAGICINKPVLEMS